MHTLENDEELHRLQTHRPAYSYRLRDGYLCSSTPYAGCATYMKSEICHWWGLSIAALTTCRRVGFRK